LSPHYQIELSREQRLDVMTVHVEAAADATDPSTRDEGQRRLARGIKDRIGVTAAVVVSDPGSVERSRGKARRVVDRRSAD
jgi:phenylacetate-CoA ligase